MFALWGQQAGQRRDQQQDDKERSLLKSRLVQAGFYNPSAPGVFLVVKAVMTFVPILLGVGAWAMGIGGELDGWAPG